MLRLTAAAFLALALASSPARSADANQPQIAHMVYFTLKDNSAAAKQKLVDACKKYLKDHDGTTFFAAGIRGEQFKRSVNDTEWDVSLHLVFKNKAAYSKYETAKTHLEFIEENKDNWSKVRVFDSEISGK